MGGSVDNAIVSWSDNTIVVDIERLESPDSVTLPPLVRTGGTVDDFRFEVVTSRGSATTEPVGYIAVPAFGTPMGSGIDDEADAPSDTRLGIGAQTLRGYQLAGVTFAIDVLNGTALSTDDGRAIDAVTTAQLDASAWAYYGATLDVRQTSGLPAVVTADPSGDPRFKAVEPTTIVVAGALDFAIDSAVYADGEVTITGSVFGWDGLPMPDDGAFTLTMLPWHAQSVTAVVTIDANGSFTAVGEAPESVIGDWLDLRLEYLGHLVETAGVEVVE